jgi:hypothetical protein
MQRNIAEGVRRVDDSSRGVLPTMVHRCVWFRNLVNEEALAHWKLSRQKETNIAEEPIIDYIAAMAWHLTTKTADVTISLYTV